MKIWIIDRTHCILCLTRCSFGLELLFCAQLRIFCSNRTLKHVHMTTMLCTLRVGLYYFVSHRMFCDVVLFFQKNSSFVLHNFWSLGRKFIFCDELCNIWEGWKVFLRCMDFSSKILICRFLGVKIVRKIDFLVNKEWKCAPGPKNCFFD